MKKKLISIALIPILCLYSFLGTNMLETKAGNMIPTDFFVTPESFGAEGDGVTDDTDAFQEMIASQYLNIQLTAGKSYVISDAVTIDGKKLNGNNANIIMKKSATSTAHFAFRVSGSTKLKNINFKLVNPSYDILNTDEDKSENKLMRSWYTVGIINGRDVVIEDCNFDSEDIEQGGLLDIYSDNRGVVVRGCNFDLNSQTTGGLYIRGGHNNGDTHSEDIIIEDCNIAGSSRDEVLAIWGWKNTLSNVTVKNCNIIHKKNSVKCTHLITLSGSGTVKDINIEKCNIVAYNTNSSVIKDHHVTDEAAPNENIQVNDCNIDIYSEMPLSNGIFNCEDAVVVNNCVVNDHTTTYRHSVSATADKITFNNCDFRFDGVGFAYRGNFVNCKFVNNNSIDDSLIPTAFVRSASFTNCTFSNIAAKVFAQPLATTDKFIIKNSKFESNCNIIGSSFVLCSKDLETPVVIEGNDSLQKPINMPYQTTGSVSGNIFQTNTVGKTGSMTVGTNYFN